MKNKEFNLDIAGILISLLKSDGVGMYLEELDGDTLDYGEGLDAYALYSAYSQYSRGRYVLNVVKKDMTICRIPV